MAIQCFNISPVAYQDSKWVAAWLPIQYRLHSYKWPVNSFDDEDSIASVADDNGFAKITLSATTETYVAKEYIKISGSSASGYDGVWQIRDITSATVFTLSAPYIATATGTLQRYYNNYNISVNIYTGIRSGHTLASDRPMTLRGTMNVQPDSNNEATADVGSYVRADLSPVDNNLCEYIPSGQWYGNDTSMWTSFYIAYAESYDQSDGTDVTTFTGSYFDDQDSSYDINYFYAANSVNQFQYFQGKSIGEYAVNDINPEANPALFMTEYAQPVYFVGNEFDLSIINAYTDVDLSDEGSVLEYILTEYDADGAQVATDNSVISTDDEGVYRFALSEYTVSSTTRSITLRLVKYDGAADHLLSELKTIKVVPDNCGKDPLYLKWLNAKGGWDSWLFTADQDRAIRVAERDVVRRDVFQSWDDYFSRTGTTEDDYVNTVAFEARTVRTQYMTQAENDGLRFIRVSNKVQEVYIDEQVTCGNYRHRTVLVDKADFTYRADSQRFHTAQISFRYSDLLRVQGQ